MQVTGAEITVIAGFVGNAVIYFFGHKKTVQKVEQAIINNAPELAQLGNEVIALAAKYKPPEQKISPAAQYMATQEQKPSP